MFNLLSKKNFAITATAMALAFFAVFSFAIPKAHALNSVYQVLSNTTSGYGQTVATIWSGTMNLMDALVILILIVIALANIMRYQLDSYAVKKFLPTFIMAIIAAHCSFLVARIIIDFANIVMSLFLFGDTQNNVTGAFDAIIGKGPDGPKGFAGNYVGYILSYTLKQLLVIVGAVLVLILSFIFLIRNYLIYFLVAIAPLGFMAMVLPATKKYFQMWWSNFVKWAFMPVISLFWLWLAGQFMSAVNQEAESGPWFMTLAFAGLCFYMAITSPFKVDKLVGTWSGWGKKAWGKTGGQATGAVKAGFERKYNRAKLETTNKIMATKLGTKYERYMGKQTYLDQQAQDVRSKRQENAQKDIYTEAYRDHLLGKKTMNPDQLGRVKARMRTWEADEQKGVKGSVPTEMKSWLEKKGFIDPDTGLARSDKEVFAAKPDMSTRELLEGKARMKELREQKRQRYFKVEAERAWDPMFIDENTRRRAESGDIADSLVYDGHGRGVPPPPPPGNAGAAGATPPPTVPIGDTREFAQAVDQLTQAAEDLTQAADEISRGGEHEPSFSGNADADVMASKLSKAIQELDSKEHTGGEPKEVKVVGYSGPAMAQKKQIETTMAQRRQTYDQRNSEIQGGKLDALRKAIEDKENTDRLASDGLNALGGGEK